MQERLAYFFLIVVLILLIAIVFGVLGKGEYQPPTPGQQGSAGQVVSM